MFAPNAIQRVADGLHLRSQYNKLSLRSACYRVADGFDLRSQYNIGHNGVAAGSATAPRLWMIGCVQPSPHSRLRRQCGVIEDVTARAVNITDYQMVIYRISPWFVGAYSNTP